MAKIIEFYIPSSFRKKAMKWIPQEHKGKLIQFDMGAGRAMARISQATSRAYRTVIRPFRPFRQIFVDLSGVAAEIRSEQRQKLEEVANDSAAA